MRNQCLGGLLGGQHTATSRKPLADRSQGRIMKDQLAARDSRDNLAGQVVLCRAQAPGGDDKTGPLKRIKQAASMSFGVSPIIVL